MKLDRREILAASVAAAALACQKTVEERQSEQPDAANGQGIPGPYPGRVVAVRHEGSTLNGAHQPGAVKQMIERGMTELTHAEGATDAWRQFFEPGDVVGIKFNPVGHPEVYCGPEVLSPIVEGLESAGVQRRDIVVYDRYRDQIQRTGIEQWLPDGLRWTAASPKNPPVQLDMDGYDPDVYLHFPAIHTNYLEHYRIDDAHLRRSYVARFVTREVNKIINVCLLKHHQSAGVTLALKNMSHGFVNNVSRSHVTITANTCGTFIPAVVDLPVIRRKVVLNIMDGIRGVYHGGPGARPRYVWEHKTMYFGTDPVAMDKTGLADIDARRAAAGMPSIALSKPDDHSHYLNGQVEHIELAGNMGLGVFDEEEIRVKRIDAA
jgi:uncharacterized protein (DUF362 family)